MRGVLKLKKSAFDTAMGYRQMEDMIPNSSMLREVRWQYADMANGGDGGELGFGEEGTTCRSHNYPGYPDSFFQEVCALLGWRW